MSMTTSKTSSGEEGRTRAVVAERTATLHDKDAPRLAATYASGRAATDLQPEAGHG